MKKLKVAMLALLCGTTLAIMTGCGNDQSATAADEVDKLTIVQMPDETNPDAGTKNDEFRKDMEKELGIEIEELEGAEYSVGIEAMKAGKLDVLLVTPMSYYQAKKVAGVEPLVTTTSMGEKPYRTVFIVNKDDKETQSLEDLKGKTFAFVDPASSSGYMFPKSKLVNELDLDPDQLENPDYFFKTVAYSGKHDSSIMGVIKGDYEAAAVAEQIIPQLVEAGMMKEDDIRIVGETDVIPNACFVIRADLPQEMKDKIKGFYLNYENGDYFETLYGSKDVRFVEAKDEDYDVVKEMVETLNIEETE
ncbi:phosphate/phosphite/phosphonate ABC transporter substrate-binding protein [Candidatus Enterococcus ferrettii]|uniref:Phosphonate transport system substrate-binding protein n=1 Tax=Candidatus Enterococcus ferrettii TaxID=2815324 RepID=A0ABV0ENA2_9ENTE|nr:phosphate/phosphite/phosphonate ABC transporter substrate-binding protein [Enterococcus sp. 665A]MBO1339093.1 phosphate/phosphite/phosphonate ABC transporter substrate-binding protein [Enterococcus sp. 665A]